MIKNILFDFDGVILDSMNIRDRGFEEIIIKYDESKVEEFIKFHRFNGGLSRFYKLRYFFEKILDQEVSDDKIQELAEEFSKIMRRELVKKKYLISETIKFIKENYKNYRFFIVSGSEQNELRYLCEKLEIDKYFEQILGSPIHKNDLIKNLIKELNLKKDECLLIGDSYNDYEAAEVNKIVFFGYNNKNLLKYSENYIENMSKLKIELIK